MRIEIPASEKRERTAEQARRVHGMPQFIVREVEESLRLRDPPIHAPGAGAPESAAETVDDVPVSDNVTPGRAAPEESVIRPVITPSWAQHVADTISMSDADTRTLVSFAITPPERADSAWSQRSADDEVDEVARNLWRRDGRGKRNLVTASRNRPAPRVAVLARHRVPLRA